MAAVARRPFAGVSFLIHSHSAFPPGALHESSILSSRSTGYDFALLAPAHRSRYRPRTPDRQESSARNCDQWTQDDRQLLLASREIQSRSPRLPGKRERLHRCGDEADRASAEKAL